VTPIVVIIDDDIDLLRMIERLLGKVGARTRTFSLACEALAFLEDQGEQVAAVCVDLALPDVSGFEVCGRLSAHPRLKGVPLLVMSGRTGIDEEARALDAGADLFLAKPFRPRRLLDELEPFLRAASVKAPQVSE
jgi:DNA-binding response OmpR family regulator